MIDTHTHLHDRKFDDDRDAVVERAHTAGVLQMITIGTSVAESTQAVSCAMQYDGVFASVGIHPHVFNGGAERSDEWQRELGVDVSRDVRTRALARAMRELQDLAQRNATKVVAVGECGLDYFAHDGGMITREQRDWQAMGFMAQIALAEERALPVIVHGRGSTRESMDAYEDIARIIGQSTNVRFVMHCYMGDVAMTEKLLALPNTIFSFAGNVTYGKKNATGPMDDVLRIIPTTRMIVETDAPYLSPVPHRGKRNESAFVADTLAYVSRIRDEDIAVLDAATTSTAQSVFALRQGV